MKKMMFIFCCLLSTFHFTSCSDDNPKETIPDNENTENGNGTTAPQDGKILIVYFSRAGENWNVGYVDRGNTAIMGDYIKEFTGGDVFEITPQTPYPDDYDTMLEICRQEVDNDTRPAIKKGIGEFG